MGRVYCCPNCNNRSIIYKYELRRTVCEKCGTPLKEFQLDRKELVLACMHYKSQFLEVHHRN